MIFHVADYIRETGLCCRRAERPCRDVAISKFVVEIAHLPHRRCGLFVTLVRNDRIGVNQKCVPGLQHFLARHTPQEVSMKAALFGCLAVLAVLLYIGCRPSALRLRLSPDLPFRRSGGHGHILKKRL
jgi:hypothetical protein